MRARTDIEWEDIKLAICNGMTSSEASKRWNVSATAIRKRASREQWPTPTALQNKIAEMKQQLKPNNSKGLVTVSSQPLEIGQEAPVTPVTPVSVLDAMAENWLEKGASHRALAFRIATKALQELEARGIPLPEDWHAIEKADKIARRAAGVENDNATKVNVSLKLVNQRIIAMRQASE
jgi:hypothetical protein